MSEEKNNNEKQVESKPDIAENSGFGKQNRSAFLKGYSDKNPRVRRDIFEDYVKVNSFELDLPNTQNKMIISLHRRKNDDNDHLLKWTIGKSSMFIDAKTTFVVSEAMRHLTEDVVPDELKPLADIKQMEDTNDN